MKTELEGRLNTFPFEAVSGFVGFPNYSDEQRRPLYMAEIRRFLWIGDGIRKLCRKQTVAFVGGYHSDFDDNWGTVENGVARMVIMALCILEHSCIPSMDSRGCAEINGASLLL